MILHNLHLLLICKDHKFKLDIEKVFDQLMLPLKLS